MDRSLTAAAGSGSTAAAIDESYALQTFMSHVAESVHAGGRHALDEGSLQTAFGYVQLGSVCDYAQPDIVFNHVQLGRVCKCWCRALLAAAASAPSRDVRVL